MNERIGELYTQALEYADSRVPPERRYNDIYYAIVSGKHAELIVAECLKIAKNREDEFESAGLLEQSNAVGNVAYRISRQFGVKR
jgi:hypothetical protein